MKRKTNDKNILLMHQKKILFLKALKNNPGMDEPIPDDVLIPEDLIYDDYTLPWVSINYYDPRIDVNDNVIIPFYVTDYYQCEYRYDIYKEFKVRCEIDGEVFFKVVKAGDNVVDFGKVSEGEHFFSLQVEDWNGIKSRRSFHNIWVYDKTRYQEEIDNATYEMTEQDLINYNITLELDETATAEQMQNNRVGLTTFFEDLHNEGYKKCILLNGVYRVNRALRLGTIKDGTCPIFIPSDFTLDMNGSTIKLHPYSDSEYGNIGQVENMIVSIFNCHDSHLINGTIEGDFAERQTNGWASGYNGEGSNGAGITGGSYCSMKNMIFTKITGYNVGTGQAGDYLPHNSIGSCTWEDNKTIIDGIEVENENYCTSTMSRMEDNAINAKYLVTSVWLAFGGLAGTEWDMQYHFYDDNQNFIETIIAYQFTKVRIPKNARFLRRTFKCKASEIGAKGNLHYMNVTENSILENCHWIDNRTCSAPCQFQHYTYKDCTFTRSGQSITPCEVDIEDGWEQCQDFFFLNNEILENTGTADFIDCAGINHNFIDNKNFGITLRHRIIGSTVKNNVGGNCNVTRGFMNKNITRVFNNVFSTVRSSMTEPYFSGHERTKLIIKNNEITAYNGSSYASTKHCEEVRNCKITITGYIANCNVYDSNLFFYSKAAYWGDNMLFTNCNIYEAENSETPGVINFSINNPQYGRRLLNKCIVHSNLNISNHNQLASICFTECEFKGTVSMAPNKSIESLCTGQMQFNKCIFRDKITVTMDGPVYVEFNDCIFENGYEFKGAYAQNCIINDYVPNNVQYIGVDDITDGNYLKVNETVSYKYTTMPYTVMPKNVTAYDSSDLFKIYKDSNGVNWLTPIKIGTTDLIINADGFEGRKTFNVVDIDYSYGRLNYNGSTSSIVGNYTNNRYDTIEGGKTYKFATRSYARQMTVLQYDENNNVVDYSCYQKTTTATVLDNGENEYSVTVTMVATAVKVRFSVVVQNASSTNMNKVFGTYTVTEVD